MQQKVKVWDIAVRFFHWSQLVLVALLWYTGEEGMMALHQLCAFSLLALVISRLVWGFFGSSTARFSHFSASPAKALRYLRKPFAVAGHNPASFYMIVLLLLLLLVQLLSGLATFDNSYLSDGPLVSVLPASWVEVASDVHSININILLAAIAIHVVAAVWHSLRVHNVILTMITGKDSGVSEEIVLKKNRWFFLLLTAILVLLYWWQGAALVALL
ncbi:cytochrome b/b6 domain-containing protein [Rheinheimera baltica]|uniref:cytochrome b/b6 domain-containing protein n=1 Tax=Rheinheimera baltica TaxID=67576 RepID=UPI0003FD7F09|nr:cytochrome b/b6 domain-containing protein [Rheinheimera baltica]MDP5189906.1 cytochrome b/b6 domain-containing protein [Rheinheimera baltica]